MWTIKVETTVLRKLFATVLLTILVPLAGCGANSMQDITSKAEKAKTREQLESILGKPDKFEKVKLGLSFESWTYTATDGEVNFTIVGDKVQGVVTAPKKKEK